MKSIFNIFLILFFSFLVKAIIFNKTAKNVKITIFDDIYEVAVQNHKEIKVFFCVDNFSKMIVLMESFFSVILPENSSKYGTIHS